MLSDRRSVELLIQAEGRIETVALMRKKLIKSFNFILFRLIKIQYTYSFTVFFEFLIPIFDFVLSSCSYLSQPKTQRLTNCMTIITTMSVHK